MRNLVRWQTLEKGLPLGLLSTAACVPYVWTSSPSTPLRTAQLWVLPFVMVVLALATVAWGEPARPRREQWRLALCLAAPAGVVLGVIYTLGEDRYMVEFLWDRFPKTASDVLLALPWVGLFQTLFAVTGTYAFALRLFHRRLAGLVAVVLVHQALLLVQLRGESLPVEVLALGALFAGLHGLVLGWSYIAVGFAGPATVAVVCQLRHLVRILLP